MILIPTKRQWKNWTLPSKVGYIGLILSIVAIILWFLNVWIQIQFGASKKLQEQSLGKQNEISQQWKDILRQQEDIKNILLTKMNKIESDNYTELIAKYPLGYVLFSIDHRNIIIPNSSVLLKDYEIDWNSAKILSISEDEISIRLPTIIQTKKNISLFEVTFVGKRIIGVFDHPMNIMGTKIVAELLEDTKEGIIALIGFKPASNQ